MQGSVVITETSVYLLMFVWFQNGAWKGVEGEDVFYDLLVLAFNHVCKHDIVSG